MGFVAAKTKVLAPKVHRILNVHKDELSGITTCFIVMDYIEGMCISDCWAGLDEKAKSSVTDQVANIILNLQSVRVWEPPGPLNCDEPFRGIWYTDYGAGPFPTRQDLEYWLNHKLDICQACTQAPKDIPRFKLIF